MNTTTKARPAIEMTPVKSSQLAKVGYDKDSQTLAIEFHGGSVYHYANFTPEDNAALMGAESLGSHFIRKIKPQTERFPYTRIH